MANPLAVAAVPAGISSVARLLGGLIGQSSADESAKFARQQLKFQKLAAKKGIQWRVKDARAAGIHPLYAIGAQTFSPSPISVSGSSPMADAVTGMGQDISRAAEQYMTADERALSRTSQMLGIQNQGLQNELLGVQIAKLRQAISTPTLPNHEGPGTGTGYRFLGMDVLPNPGSSDVGGPMQQRGGETLEWLAGIPVTVSDLLYTFAQSALNRSAAKYPMRGPNAGSMYAPR